MKKTQITLRGGTALRALALVAASAAGAAMFAAPATAQDYTSGAIGGIVTDENGAPVSGAVVTITSDAQGTTRTVTSNNAGTIRVAGLQTGSYTISAEVDGKPGWRAEGVSILAGQTVQLNIALSSGEEIVVTGSKAVAAFSGTTTGLNVDVAELVKTNPLGRDLTSVILLAPGTSGGDSAFGNLASIGGSSVAENAYYLNGLNITNFDNYLGSARVPFDFYRSVEVKSGGYPAEFGRATGGIVNAVTKSGTNEFTGAIHLNWTPNFLRSNAENLMSWNGREFVRSTNRAADEQDNYSAIVEAGGPIFRDRLFVYGLAEFRRDTSLTNNPLSGTAFKYRNDDPFWGVKVDAYPLDDHHLEFTIFDTRNTNVRNTLGYSVVNGENIYGTATSTDEYRSGGVNYVAKYTGRFTDWFTLSGAYGRMRDRFDNFGTGGAGGQPYFANGSQTVLNGVPNGGFFNGQRTQSVTFPWKTEREFYRADADLFFNLLGDHHVRGGFDQENNSLSKVSVRTGNSFLGASGFLSQTALNAGLGGAGAALIFRPAVLGINPTTGAQQTTDGLNVPVYLEINYFNSGGSFEAKNKAYYIEDEWRVTDRLTLNLGVRRDDFAVNRADGVNLVTLDKNYAPRIGVTYNLWGDKSGKVFGSYSQYYLPFASNTAFRMTGSEYYFREAWAFNGFNATTGLPNLTTQITNLRNFQAACPFTLTNGSSGSNCGVTGDGSVADASALIGHNLKATKESEWIVGYEQKFGSWTVGLSYTHRNLDNTAEDAAIDAAVIAYCQANGLTGCEDTWTGFHQYTILNPGKNLVVNLDGQDGREVTFTPDQLGYPAAKRTFDAVELTWNRAWDGKWSFGGSYTWSTSKGNSEGFVQSDFGQSDAGITQDFDQPGFVDYAYGYLPNHRRHRVKLWGALALSDAFTVGSNVQIQSPRKFSCFGYHPTDVFALQYGAASHYCGGEPAPRGEGLESDWFSTIDLSARYNVKFGDRNVTFRADVFNLLNSQGITERQETGESNIGVANPAYGLATGYQTPRYVRLGLDIAF